MIGFGELRRLSLQWQADIAAVERIYALDWLLKGIFDLSGFGVMLSLKDSAALGKAYFSDYPQPEEADLAMDARLDSHALQSVLAEVASSAASESGMQFRLAGMTGAAARFEFTGPLGRRSAAQPHLALRFFHDKPRDPIVERPLIHPFSDATSATVRAVSLNELAAERLALLGGRPRPRDVYDLWFILRHGADQLDREETRRLAERISGEKGRVLKPELDPAHRAALAASWENALKKLPRRPTLDQTVQEINGLMRLFFA